MSFDLHPTTEDLTSAVHLDDTKAQITPSGICEEKDIPPSDTTNITNTAHQSTPANPYNSDDCPDLIPSNPEQPPCVKAAVVETTSETVPSSSTMCKVCGVNPPKNRFTIYCGDVCRDKGRASLLPLCRECKLNRVSSSTREVCDGCDQKFLFPARKRPGGGAASAWDGTHRTKRCEDEDGDCATAVKAEGKMWVPPDGDNRHSLPLLKEWLAEIASVSPTEATEVLFERFKSIAEMDPPPYDVFCPCGINIRRRMIVELIVAPHDRTWVGSCCIKKFKGTLQKQCQEPECTNPVAKVTHDRTFVLKVLGLPERPGLCKTHLALEVEPKFLTLNPHRPEQWRTLAAYKSSLDGIIDARRVARLLRSDLRFVIQLKFFEPIKPDPFDVDLRVSFADHKIAKYVYGAKWDPTAKTWFIPWSMKNRENFEALVHRYGPISIRAARSCT